MNFPRETVWLIPLLPLIGAAINGLSGFFGLRFPKKVSAGIAIGAMLGAFGLSCLTVWDLMHAAPEARHYVDLVYSWIHVGKLEVPLGFLVDPLSSVMILIITGVGSLIHIYSAGYMSHDPGFQRFFAYLNLFVFFMLLLVLGENILVMFVGWEGVGLCSYLLIGFWFQEKANAVAGMKAFIVNRIGDFAFIVGFSLLYWAFIQKGVYTLSFDAIRENAPLLKDMVGPMGFSLVAVVTFLFFFGATGKSAQIPLYVWLPDAMAGPTPVSALIHAATMVTAGVYMIGRNHFLYTMAPETMTVVATVGALTALFAGTIGVCQNDIKKVLAYSTVSQLGYMFLGMGVGAFSAGIMHLMTHAFFKGLMFLGAGSVIHAMHHEQDMRQMGGLRKYLPVTFLTFLCGYVAIIGFPFTSGFISKDEILWKTFSSGNYGKFLWVIGLLGAGATAFYMTRLMMMTFFGKSRTDHHSAEHVHESPRLMTVPLMILAVLSLLGGAIGWPHVLGGNSRFEHWLEPVFASSVVTPAEHAGVDAAVAVENEESDNPAHGGNFSSTEAIEVAHEGGASEAHDHRLVEIMLMVVSVSFASAAFYLAYRFYILEPEKPARIAKQHPKIYETLLNKYYVDEIYEAIFVKNLLRLNQFLAKFDKVVFDGAVNMTARISLIVAQINNLIDKYIVDFLVNFVAYVSQATGSILRQTQTGKIQNYLYVAVASMTGIALLLAYQMLF